jgi:hypothetical protein
MKADAMDLTDSMLQRRLAPGSFILCGCRSSGSKLLAIREAAWRERMAAVTRTPKLIHVDVQ